MAAGLNVAVGVTALLFGRRLVAGPEEAPPAGRWSGSYRLALAVAAVSGALALVCEVAWTRALSLVLGSTVYAFTIMLVTFLLGLAAGSFLMARWADRLREIGVAIVLVQLATALSTALGLALLGELPYAFVRLFALSGGDHARFLPAPVPDHRRRDPRARAVLGRDLPAVRAPDGRRGPAGGRGGGHAAGRQHPRARSPAPSSPASPSCRWSASRAR